MTVDLSHPARLIVGCLTRAPRPLAGIREALVREFGPIDAEAGPFSFAFTRYYEEEMGTGLVRTFYAFSRPVDAAALADIKRTTIRIEGEWAREHSAAFGIPRPVNLDPGYIDAAKLVLATTKDHAHRIYLRDGIHAEVTLQYRDGAFQSQPWTYPDYRTPEYLAFFEAVRRRYFCDLPKANQSMYQS